MGAIARQCTSCGRQDNHERWPSVDDAAKAGALKAAWNCPFCGAVEPDLVEGMGQPKPAEAVAGLNPNLAELPDDPDERRRAVETTLPLNHP